MGGGVPFLSRFDTKINAIKKLPGKQKRALCYSGSNNATYNSDKQEQSTLIIKFALSEKHISTT